MYTRGNFERRARKRAKQIRKMEPYILKVDAMISVGVTEEGTASILLS